jgi:hypothetical protein
MIIYSGYLTIMSLNWQLNEAGVRTKILGRDRKLWQEDILKFVPIFPVVMRD